MTEIHHVGVRVGDLEQAIRLLEQAFEVKVEHDATSTTTSRRIAYVKFANCRLELVHDAERPLPDGQLAVIDHIAIESGDIEHDMKELSRRGFPSVDQAPRKAAFGNLVAAYEVDQFSGIKLHLVSEKDEA